MIIDFIKNNGGGYEEGYVDGQDSIIGTFSSTTATANGDYGSSAHPLSSITVSVAQTGHTDQELQEAYSSGYTSGETHQKSLLSTTAITSNGNYENVNGWSGLSVSIDTASTFNSGYTSGVTDGENNIISTFTSTAVTENGQYGDSAHPLTAITVNVPTSSGGSEDFAKMIDRSITDAVIPNTVTEIGQYAFTRCTNLTGVTIQNNVKRINNGAFQYCSSLSSITIPNSVTAITDYAFQYCTSLSNITLSNSVSGLAYGLFDGCTSLSSVTIPSSVTGIGWNVFSNCSSLSSVTMPSGLRGIDGNAFRNCTSLNEIHISAETAPSFGNANVFQGVPSTGTVHIPSGADYSSWQSNQYLSGWTFESPTPTPTGSTGTLTISVGDSLNEEHSEYFDGYYVPYTITLSGQSQDVVGIVHYACSQMDYDMGDYPDSLEYFQNVASYETGNTVNGRLVAEGLPEEGMTVDYVFIKAYGIDSNGNIIQSVSAITEDIEMSFEPIVDETCSLCGGSGEIEEDGEMVTCPQCGGSGIEPTPEEEEPIE